MNEDQHLGWSPLRRHGGFEFECAGHTVFVDAEFDPQSGRARGFAVIPLELVAEIGDRVLGPALEARSPGVELLDEFDLIQILAWRRIMEIHAARVEERGRPVDKGLLIAEWSPAFRRVGGEPPESETAAE